MEATPSDDGAAPPVSAEETTAADEPAPHTPPWWAPLTLVAFVALIICTNVANAVWARWVNTSPEGLLLLSSRQRYLVLVVAGGISPFTYVVIGTVRIAAAFIVCHLIGRAYRDTALSWFTRYLGITPEALDVYNRNFTKAEIGLIPFFAGSNIVAVLTGVHRTPPVRLAVLLGRRHRRAAGADVVAGQDVRGASARRPRLPAALPVVGARNLGGHRVARQPPQLPSWRTVVTPSEVARSV